MFGFAENNTELLAKTMLGIMIKCLYGGPKFLVKMIPVAKLDAQYLYDHVTTIINLIGNLNGEIISVISDDNRVNQAFFKKFETVSNKPRLTKNGLYLLFDYVHLLKSSRNNWLTETCSELMFFSQEGKEMIARWDILEKLYEHEKNQFIQLSGEPIHTITSNLSKLTEVAVHPKPVERQKVALCLKIFYDETVAALKSH